MRTWTVSEASILMVYPLGVCGKDGCSAVCDGKRVARPRQEWRGRGGGGVLGLGGEAACSTGGPPRPSVEGSPEGGALPGFWGGFAAGGRPHCPSRSLPQLSPSTPGGP